MSLQGASLTDMLFDDAHDGDVDPFDLFETWLAEAVRSEINDANAMSLASIDAGGMPDLRMVLLNGHDRRGFVFFTNAESAKGRQIEARPAAALLFHWKSLRRQVRIRGPVDVVSAAEADAYFATRPRESRIGAHASDQSRPLASRAALIERVATVTDAFAGRDVPRPAHWSGFRVVPREIEFWKDGAFRLHDRIVFRRLDPGADWSRARLYP